MNTETLQAAIGEAKRFLEKAKFALECRKMADGTFSMRGDDYGSANAAARRASMDLTQSLARMRNG